MRGTSGDNNDSSATRAINHIHWGRLQNCLLCEFSLLVVCGPSGFELEPRKALLGLWTPHGMVAELGDTRSQRSYRTRQLQTLEAMLGMKTSSSVYTASQGCRQQERSWARGQSRT